MRQFGVVLAAATAVVGLTACSSDEPSPTATDEVKSWNIGFANGNTTPFHQCLEAAITEEAQALGSTVTVLNAGQDPAKEKANVESLIGQGVDALIVQTVNTDALSSTLTEAKEAGIPVFLTSVLPSGGPSNPDFVGAAVVDLAGVGKLDAQWVADDAAGAAVKVGIIKGAPGAASDLLVNGFKDNLPANATVAAEEAGMFNPQLAKQVAEGMVDLDLDYVFIANEEMALSAWTAFDAAGQGDIKIVSNNGTDDGIQAIKDGKLAATVANSPDQTGTNAIETIIKYLNGEQIDKITSTPITLIDKDNLADAPKYCRL